MEILHEAERITELERAFRRYSDTVPGLGVDVVGTVSGAETLVHPVAGFQVRLEPEHSPVGVALYVSSHYGELRRWTRCAGRDAEPARSRERFSVRLSEGFDWGESSFPTADGLAHDLLAYMQYNLDSFSG
jgi:hypothetical protein